MFKVKINVNKVVKNFKTKKNKTKFLALFANFCLVF